jgi:hypothetical protein
MTMPRNKSAEGDSMIRLSFISSLICLLGLTLAGVTAAASDDLLCQLDTFPDSVHHSQSLAVLPSSETFSDRTGVIATVSVPDRENMILTLQKGQLKTETTFKSYYSGRFEGTITLENPGLDKSLIAGLQCVEVSIRR